MTTTEDLARKHRLAEAATVKESDRLRAENKDLTTQLLRLREVVDICEEGSVRSLVAEAERLRDGLEEMAATACVEENPLSEDECERVPCNHSGSGLKKKHHWCCGCQIATSAADLLGKPDDWRPADEDKG